MSHTGATDLQRLCGMWTALRCQCARSNLMAHPRLAPSLALHFTPRLIQHLAQYLLALNRAPAISLRNLAPQSRSASSLRKLAPQSRSAISRHVEHRVSPHFKRRGVAFCTQVQVPHEAQLVQLCEGGELRAIGIRTHESEEILGLHTAAFVQPK